MDSRVRFSGQPSTVDLLDSARAQDHDFDLLLKRVPPSELLSEIGKRIDSTCDVPAGSQSRVEGPQRFISSPGARLTAPGHAICPQTNHKLD
jgi:hypothetical protein